MVWYSEGYRFEFSDEVVANYRLGGYSNYKYRYIACKERNRVVRELAKQYGLLTKEYGESLRKTYLSVLSNVICQRLGRRIENQKYFVKYIEDIDNIYIFGFGNHIFSFST